jgi:hypothetical protein
MKEFFKKHKDRLLLTLSLMLLLVSLFSLMVNFVYFYQKATKFENSNTEAQWISYSCELKDKAIIDNLIIRCLKNTTVGEIDCHGKIAYIFGCKQTSITDEKLAGLIIWPIGVK